MVVGEEADDEDFDMEKNVILEDKVADFQVAYKDPDEFCCLFVVDEAFTNFVFVPYPED